MTPGIYRRRIRVFADAATASAELEDDPHRVGVRIEHDGARVTAAAGATPRTPWSRCPEAAAMLERLVGMPLTPDPLAVHAHTAGRDQCTHMFDLAGLAVAHAARGIAARQYDAEVSVPPGGGGLRHALLRRDGRPVLSWVVQGTAILGPDPFAGRDLRGLLSWAETACAEDADGFEAVMVLRRAIHISDARLMDLDAIASPAVLGRYANACYVFQPDRAATSTRRTGSTRDFTDAPDALLA